MCSDVARGCGRGDALSARAPIRKVCLVVANDIRRYDIRRSRRRSVAAAVTIIAATISIIVVAVVATVIVVIAIVAAIVGAVMVPVVAPVMTTVVRIMVVAAVLVAVEIGLIRACDRWESRSTDRECEGDDLRYRPALIDC